ncbi:hypothetical protein NCCP2145_33440 [Pseudarthrobacter sp. NCCP-2145]|nr:hypothetical protein NCCP2145_33440 [Pseudarthrobacter sp. NCCP-2145]
MGQDGAQQQGRQLAGVSGEELPQRLAGRQRIFAHGQTLSNAGAAAPPLTCWRSHGRVRFPLAGAWEG